MDAKQGRGNRWATSCEAEATTGALGAGPLSMVVPGGPTLPADPSPSQPCPLTFLTVPAAAAMSSLPTAVEPVKPILRTVSLDVSSVPAALGRLAIGGWRLGRRTGRACASGGRPRTRQPPPHRPGPSRYTSGAYQPRHLISCSPLLDRTPAPLHDPHPEHPWLAHARGPCLPHSPLSLTPIPPKPPFPLPAPPPDTTPIRPCPQPSYLAPNPLAHLLPLRLP